MPEMKEKFLILITNDDGYESKGLLALFNAMPDNVRTVIVAPDRDKSAISHSITMNRPLCIQKKAHDIYAINGTPTDCVTLGMAKILERKPDLLVSGINPGENVGDDIAYSGTVSAAIEGTMLGIPSLAVSREGTTEENFTHAAEFTKNLALHVLHTTLPTDTLLNINYPSKKPVGVKLTHQGRRTYEGSINEIFDPWGQKHYWIGGGTPSIEKRIDADAWALRNGYISITPLHLDLTNYAALKYLQETYHFSEDDNGFTVE